MNNLFVTCPETGNREQVGCLSARDGEVLVVLRCSRFEHPYVPTCTMSCVHEPVETPVTCIDRWRIAH
jgi:hypothetical protein